MTAVSDHGGDEASIELSLTSIPVQSWDVRRRRYGDQRWLVRHNETFEMDPFTDAVWRACGAKVSVAAVAKLVADELDLPPVELLEPTMSALALLGDVGLVTFAAGD